MHKQSRARAAPWLDEWKRRLLMAKIKLILCDDEGNAISEVKAKDYAEDVGK